MKVCYQFGLMFIAMQEEEEDREEASDSEEEAGEEAELSEQVNILCLLGY